MLNRYPYNPARPIQQADLFFNREEAISELMDGLQEPLPRSFFVIGGRRTGKTSTLLHVRHQLNLLSHEPRILPVYYNLQQLSSNSPESLFFEILLQTLRGCLMELNALELIQSKSTKYIDSDEDLSHTFQYALNLLNAQNYRLILLLDEVEQILDTGWAHKLLSQFNFWVSNFQFSLVIGMVDQAAFQRIAVSDKAAIEFTDILMEPFDFDTSKKLIVTPSKPKLEFSDEIVQVIYHQTGGHPYLLHALLDRIWRTFEGDVGMDVLESALHWFDERKVKNSFELWYRYEFTSLSQEILKVLVKEGPQTAHSLQAKIQAMTYINDALDQLSRTCLVRIVQGQRDQYEIGSQMFKDWLIRYTLLNMDY